MKLKNSSTTLLIYNRTLPAGVFVDVKGRPADSGFSRTVYLLKEEFRTIFEKVRSREQAARFIDAWILKAERTGDKFLAKFNSTLKNWRDQILNYFIERISNGFVEGTNNALRVYNTHRVRR